MKNYLLDILLAPFTFISTIWFKKIRKKGIHKMTQSNKIFNSLGLLPVDDHYYEPLINPTKHLLKSLRIDRNL